MSKIEVLVVTVIIFLLGAVFYGAYQEKSEYKESILRVEKKISYINKHHEPAVTTYVKVGSAFTPVKGPDSYWVTYRCLLKDGSEDFVTFKVSRNEYMTAGVKQ